MKKPEKCCDFGTYECQVPMAIAGRRQDIDFCIADIVAALNAANITTVSSCCGHGKIPGSIVLEDGRELTIGKIFITRHLITRNGGKNA
jgi:tRNA(Phe) wybutosine-synthesizing methylase Tyw3